MATKHESKKVFTSDVETLPLGTVASKWVLEVVPHIFSGNTDKYIIWKHTLGRQIDIDPRAICIVGGAAVGFSLNPNKNYKPFDKKSDVDVAAVSHFYFTLAWNWMINLGATRYRFSPIVQAAINDHRQRLIYFGIIASDRILHHLPFGKKWYVALNDVAGLPPIDGRNVNIRIYRNFSALRAYQVNGLKKLRTRVLEKST